MNQSQPVPVFDHNDPTGIVERAIFHHQALHHQALHHPALQRLADTVDGLTAWMGSILPELDAAPAKIGDDDWRPATRDRGDHTLSESADTLDGEAAYHLAAYAVARSRSLQIKADVLD